MCRKIFVIAAVTAAAILLGLIIWLDEAGLLHKVDWSLMKI